MLTAEKSETQSLYDCCLPDQDPIDKQGCNWFSLSLVVLLIMGFAILCSIVVFGFLLSIPTQGDTTKADTPASMSVPETSAPMFTRLLEEPRPLLRTYSFTPAPTYAIPYLSTNHGDCTGPLCRTLATRLRSKLDSSVHPCQDFYKYVCNTFRGEDEFKHLKKDVQLTNIAILSDADIPPSNQRSWQKAAAMYQACLSFASSDVPETKYLVEWMASLNLDLLNETALAAVNPVEMMVRGSLDLGVEAVISIIFQKLEFQSGKRSIRIDYSDEQGMWRVQKRSMDDYVELLGKYGARPPLDKQLASKLRGYEDELEKIADAVESERRRQEVIPISKLGEYTTPYVTPNQWVSFISKYTKGTYRGGDEIVHRPESTSVIKRLFENKSVGENGQRYLVAWSFYRQLFEHTQPELFRLGRSPSEACYEHIKKVMDLAVISPYFTKMVPPRMVYQTRRMVSRIRSAFEQAMNSSKWMSPTVRDEAINKLIDITVYVGSSGRRLDPEFVEHVYRPYPDAPLDRLFPTWIKALSLSSHYIWTDQTNPLFDETALNAYYSFIYNNVFIPTALMHQPFLYLYGPIGLNYAGLGMIIAHEIMHAFDVQGIRRNKDFQDWTTEEFVANYTKRALCLRRSHKSVLSLDTRNELNDYLDSENLADLVGTTIAYAAYASLPPKYKSVALAGYDMSTERLFFVNHCVKWCAQHSQLSRRYAPFRSRCIVPLMNMPEFSNAFGCAAGTPMNPRKKCKFW